MAYKFRTIEKMVGIFVVISLVIIIAALILILRGQHIIVKKYYFTTEFNSAENLSTGMPIKLKGIKIGALTHLELNDVNRIVAKFYILCEYAHKIKKDSVLMINAPLIGEKFIEITEGSKESQLAENNDFLYSIDSEKGREYLAKQMKSMPATPTDLILKNVQLLTAQLSDPQGSFMQTLANFKKLSESLAENRDVIKEMMAQLKATGENLKLISENLKNNPLLKGELFPAKSEKETEQKRKR